MLGRAKSRRGVWEGDRFDRKLIIIIIATQRIALTHTPNVINSVLTISRTRNGITFTEALWWHNDEEK